MEINIDVDVSFNEKVIRQNVFYFLNHVSKLWLAFPCFAVILIVIIVNGINSGFTEYVYGLLAVYLAAFLIFYGLFYLRIVNGFVDVYRKRKGGTFTFSDTDVKVVGKEVQSTCAWSVFKEAFDFPTALEFKKY